MSSSELSLDIAVIGIVIASSSNTLIKAMLAVFFGASGLGVRVLLPLIVAASAGLIITWLL